MYAAATGGDNTMGYIKPDPSGGPNKVLFKLNHFGAPWQEGSLVEYQDVAEAKRVFGAMKHTYVNIRSLATPICYKNNLILFERCSDDYAFTTLVAEGFPLRETWDTVRTAISTMFDMHEWGVGGLPPEVSDFVRTDRWDYYYLYYASTRRESCGTDAQWETVVQQDYLRMEKFVRKLIHDEPPNSLDLMKSEALFNHFVNVLHDFSTKSYEDKQKHKSLVLRHPLLMSYAQIQGFLRVAGWRCPRRDSDSGPNADAVRSIDDVDWITNVSCANNWRYLARMASKPNHYRGSYFLLFCYDLINNANEFNLWADGFSWPRMFQQFEEFYPSYLGRLWAALDERGVCPHVDP